MAYGKNVHTALEEYVIDGVPLPSNYAPYQKYMDVIKEIPGVKYPEMQMALKEDKIPCDFEDEDYWVRGIGDLIIIDNTDGYYIDYKTGNDRYADVNQLKLMSAMMFIYFPEVNHIKAGLLFITKNSFINEEYDRKDLNKLWLAFYGDLVRLEQSIKENYWPPNPSGLCKRHCVVATCEHHGRG